MDCGIATDCQEQNKSQESFEYFPFALHFFKFYYFSLQPPRTTHEPVRSVGCITYNRADNAQAMHDIT